MILKKKDKSFKKELKEKKLQATLKAEELAEQISQAELRLKEKSTILEKEIKTPSLKIPAA